MEMMRKLMGITRNFGNDRRRFNRKLKKAGIKFEWHPLYEGYQWTFDKFPGGDIALHAGTYGARRGYLESYCMPWDDGDVTMLSHAEAIQHLTEGK